MSYEKRFVAYMDILGFKSLIEKTKENEENYNQVNKALSTIADIRHDNYAGALSEYGIHKEITIFSDSVIISYAANVSFGGALSHILTDLVHICMELLIHDMYFRGGVTYGDLTHNKNICFGPAMNRAYEIETTIAKNPRILIDREAVKQGILNPAIHNSCDMEWESLQELLQQDRAGQFWLDVLRQCNEVDEYDYLHLLHTMKRNLQAHLTSISIPKVRKKYLWLARYYNRNLSRITRKTQKGRAMKSELQIHKSLLSKYLPT